MSFNRRTLLTLGVAITARPAAAVDTGELMVDRLNRFNEQMRDFIAKLRAHVYDAKQAALLSKLWSDVENSGDWPKS